MLENELCEPVLYGQDLGRVLMYVGRTTTTWSTARYDYHKICRMEEDKDYLDKMILTVNEAWPRLFQKITHDTLAMSILSDTYSLRGPRHESCLL